MSKEKSTKIKKERKEEKADKEGRVKKEKKDKKEKKIKKEKLSAAITDSLIEELENTKDEKKLAIIKTNDDSDNEEEMADGTLVTITESALVPFANPLADDKQEKKLFKGVKKAAKSKCIRRGVKEVVKSLRKTSSSAPSSAGSSSPTCIVIIAADISPMDVISHIPVLCEDHNIPYIYIKSRAELGQAGSTKRPTSVVMITEKSVSKKGGDEEGEWKETYADLVKLVVKAQAGVKI